MMNDMNVAVPDARSGKCLSGIKNLRALPVPGRAIECIDNIGGGRLELDDASSLRMHCFHLPL